MTEKRFALIIASYQYRDEGLRQLVAPPQDAMDLAKVLSDPAIGNYEVQTILNKPSYEANRAIEAFFADRNRNDLLLLYFSGHGIKDEDGKLYFATPDTSRKLLRTTTIPATFVNEVMRRSRSRQQVLILDCCYSGAFAKGMVAKADRTIGTKERFGGKGRVILTASDALQYAFEGDKITGKDMVRSVFTHTLIHGLRTGEADLDRNGHVSPDDLYDYVLERITEKTPHQRPEKWALGVQGEIIIAYNPTIRLEEVLANLLKTNVEEFNRLRMEKKVVFIDFSGSNFRGKNLSDANLKNVNFRKADLGKADLMRANLSEANLIGSYLARADLTEADISYADLTEANLWRVILVRSNLSKASLKLTNLVGANLWGADLRGANLWGADLGDVNLREVNLSNANLSRADLSNAKLEGAILKDIKEWKDVRSFKGTILIDVKKLSGNDLEFAERKGAIIREIQE